MKLDELHEVMMEPRYTVFVTIGGCDTDLIEVKDDLPGLEWLPGYRKLKAYGESEVAGISYNPYMGVITVHAKTDSRKEIEA